MNRMIFTLLVMIVTLVNKGAESLTNRFILPYEVREAIFDPARPRLYVIPAGANAVDVIDLESKVLRRLDLPYYPRSFAITPDSTRLYAGMVGFTAVGAVAVYNLENLEFLRQFSINISPTELAVTDSGYMVVCGDFETGTFIGAFDSATGDAIGNRGRIVLDKSLVLHPSQEFLYMVDTSWEVFWHYSLSSTGLVSRWERPFNTYVEGNRTFIFPDGSRLLTGSGQFLTSTTNYETDLKRVGQIEISGIRSVAFATNDHLLVGLGPEQVFFYDYQSNQLRETRSVPGARQLGIHGSRTAVLLGDPFFKSQSEIRFLSPRPATAAENLSPTAIIHPLLQGEVFLAGSTFPVAAQGRDQDGDIQSLRIFSGSTAVYSGPKDVVEHNVTVLPGTNQIYAVVQDAFGATATSTVITIFGNLRPQIQLDPIPATYSAPQSIPIRAMVTDPDGRVVRVALLVNDRVIASVSSGPYEFLWSPPNPGTYYLQVQAEDNFGATSETPLQTIFIEGAVDHFGPGIVLLNSTNVSLTTTNTAATRQQDEPLHAGVPGGKSLWWAWIIPTHLAETGGTLTVDTYGSNFDTLLAVYSGDPSGRLDITGLRLLAANDDDLNHSPASRVKFFISGGDTVYIAVDGRDGAAGKVNLRLTFTPSTKPPFNDNFQSAAAASLGNYVVTNIGATIQPGEPFHAGNPGGSSVWWKLQLNSVNEPIWVSTENSSFDTLLAVYTTNQNLSKVDLTNLVQVAANDDVEAGNTSSTLTFVPPKVGTYWIAVDGYNGAEGRVQLEVRNHYIAHLNVNDNFTSALPLLGVSVLRTVFNHRATLQPGEPLHAGKTNAAASLWYKWVAPSTGPVSISTRGSNFDTILAVYSGTNLTALTPVASNDDDPLISPASSVLFSAIAGTQYYIALASGGTARGEFVLTLNHSGEYSSQLLSQLSDGILTLNTTNFFGKAHLETSANLIHWQFLQSLTQTQAFSLRTATSNRMIFFRLKIVE